METTLCLIKKDDCLLLRGSVESSRKPVFPGGRLEKSETKEFGVIKEVIRGTGLYISNPFYHGYCDSTFNDSGERQRTHVFSAGSFKGALIYSGDEPFRWVRIGEIPFNSMWKDTRMWFKLVLEGKQFEAAVLYDNGFGDRIITSHIRRTDRNQVSSVIRG